MAKPGPRGEGHPAHHVLVNPEAWTAVEKVFREKPSVRSDFGQLCQYFKKGRGLLAAHVDWLAQPFWGRLPSCILGLKM